ILHLLYSRFFIKVLYDAGLLAVTEPFVRLFNQGMVKRFGQVMSKSAGNGVSIDELAGAQGADAGRIYEMFIGPPEEDVEWTDAGLNGVVKFLQRVWRLVLEPAAVAGESGPLGATVDSAALRRKVAQTVGKVTEHYDELRFNTAVAFLMELANAMQDYLRGGGARGGARERGGAGGAERRPGVEGGRRARPADPPGALTGRVGGRPGARRTLHLRTTCPGGGGGSAGGNNRWCGAVGRQKGLL